MHLGASTAVEVSTKHAQGVLQRRAAFVEEQVGMLQQNIVALDARGSFAPAKQDSGEVSCQLHPASQWRCHKVFASLPMHTCVHMQPRRHRIVQLRT